LRTARSLPRLSLPVTRRPELTRVAALDALAELGGGNAAQRRRVLAAMRDVDLATTLGPVKAFR